MGSSLFAQIARTTTESERAAAISMAMAARQIGLLFGPGLNLFLKDMNFWIGPWKVDAYSSAGVSLPFQDRSFPFYRFRKYNLVVL